MVSCSVPDPEPLVLGLPDPDTFMNKLNPKPDADLGFDGQKNQFV
jgi:hypothetical protein